MSCLSYLGAQAVSTSHTASCVAYLPFLFSMLTSSPLLESDGTEATTATLQLWSETWPSERVGRQWHQAYARCGP